MKNLMSGILLSCLCLSASAFANGSGYNGPDLNPISIPVQLDRGISIQDMENAINVCVISGDSSKGLKSTMQGLMEQLGVPGPGIQVTSEDWLRDEGVDGTKTIAFESMLLMSAADSMNQGLELSQTPGTRELRVILTGPLYGDSYLSTEDFFPFVSYGQILQDGGYDDFGNFNLSSRIVSQLMIQVPASFQTSGQAMPLRNDRSNVRSKFTVNAQEYVQCLQTELQLQAKAPIAGSK